MEAFLARLAKNVGKEAPQDQAAYDLKFALRELRPQVFGVHHLTCSDEAERETVETFQRCLVQDIVPRLKLGTCLAFRTATLGGRHEWGSVAIAESNFSGAAQKSDVKLMLVKINAHVGLTQDHTSRRYGVIDRYGRASAACGALRGFLAESTSFPLTVEIGEEPGQIVVQSGGNLYELEREGGANSSKKSSNRASRTVACEPVSSANFKHPEGYFSLKLPQDWNAKSQGADLFILECPTAGVATFLAVDQLDPEEEGQVSVDFIRKKLLSAHNRNRSSGSPTSVLSSW